MWNKFLKLFFLTVAIPFFTTRAQTIDTLVFCGLDSIAFNASFNGVVIEELSGIEYTVHSNNYLLLPQSKKNTHLFVAKIQTGNKFSVSVDSLIFLSVPQLEGESVRINPADKHMYIAEEEDNKSFIYKVDKKNELKKIFSSKGKLRHNKGYEGLCFSPDGTTMYIGLESPLKGNISTITAVNLETGKQKVYNYSLDILEHDTKSDNGITEILTLNDTTLIVVERTYMGPKYGNSIRIYKAVIPQSGNEIIKEKLLTNFSASPYIDNIEGVTFSASGKELIFVSDNNGNPRQRTLFICMKIE
ncbi:MAG: esterase-like activity of phytase family protein [Cyclobacteriaceae bacterium]|nr:esterase-like activity of phytase family protein [Cyclobacteriaceae bacterium]